MFQLGFLGGHGKRETFNKRVDDIVQGPLVPRRMEILVAIAGVIGNSKDGIAVEHHQSKGRIHFGHAVGFRHRLRFRLGAVERFDFGRHLTNEVEAVVSLGRRRHKRSRHETGSLILEGFIQFRHHADVVRQGKTALDDTHIATVLRRFLVGTALECGQLELLQSSFRRDGLHQGGRILALDMVHFVPGNRHELFLVLLVIGFCRYRREHIECNARVVTSLFDSARPQAVAVLRHKMFLKRSRVLGRKRSRRIGHPGKEILPCIGILVHIVFASHFGGVVGIA